MKCLCLFLKQPVCDVILYRKANALAMPYAPRICRHGVCGRREGSGLIFDCPPRVLIGSLGEYDGEAEKAYRSRIRMNFQRCLGRTGKILGEVNLLSVEKWVTSHFDECKIDARGMWCWRFQVLLRYGDSDCVHHSVMKCGFRLAEVGVSGNDEAQASLL